MFTEDQKKDIELLEVLKGACCTSNNLRNKLIVYSVEKKPGIEMRGFILAYFSECFNRMLPISELASERERLGNFIDNQFESATYGEIQKAAYDAHIAIDREYYKHYADKMGIVENPRK